MGGFLLQICFGLLLGVVFLGGLWGGSRESQNLTTEMQVSGFVSGGDNLP